MVLSTRPPVGENLRTHLTPSKQSPDAYRPAGGAMRSATLDRVARVCEGKNTGAWAIPTHAEQSSSLHPDSFHFRQHLNPAIHPPWRVASVNPGIRHGGPASTGATCGPRVPGAARASEATRGRSAHIRRRRRRRPASAAAAAKKAARTPRGRIAPTATIAGDTVAHAHPIPRHAPVSPDAAPGPTGSRRRRALRDIHAHLLLHSRTCKNPPRSARLFLEVL